MHASRIKQISHRTIAYNALNSSTLCTLLLRIEVPWASQNRDRLRLRPVVIADAAYLIAHTKKRSLLPKRCLCDWRTARTASKLTLMPVSSKTSLDAPSGISSPRVNSPVGSFQKPYMKKSITLGYDYIGQFCVPLCMLVHDAGYMFLQERSSVMLP